MGGRSSLLAPASGRQYTRDVNSAPIALRAGRRVPIQIEYASPGGADAHLHLYWSSRSCDPRHIPRNCCTADRRARTRVLATMFARLDLACLPLYPVWYPDWIALVRPGTLNGPFSPCLFALIASIEDGRL